MAERTAKAATRALWQAEHPRRRRSIFVLRTKVRTKSDFFQIKNEMADGRHLVFEYVEMRREGGFLSALRLAGTLFFIFEVSKIVSCEVPV